MVVFSITKKVNFELKSRFRADWLFLEKNIWLPLETNTQGHFSRCCLLLIQSQARSNFSRHNFVSKWLFTHSPSFSLCYRFKVQPTAYLLSKTPYQLRTMCMARYCSLAGKCDIPSLRETTRLIMCYENGLGPESVTYNC